MNRNQNYIYYKNKMYQRYLYDVHNGFVWLEYETIDIIDRIVRFDSKMYIELENEYRKMLRLEKLERICK